MDIENESTAQTEQTAVQDEQKKKSVYESLEALLLRSRISIELAMEDTSLQVPLGSYGYELPVLQEGERKVLTAEDCYYGQKRAYEHQYNATIAFNLAWQEADAFYMRMVKVARVAFRDSCMLQTHLYLSGDREDGFDKWVPQATQFYYNALNTPDIIAGFDPFKVTPVVLAEGQALVDAAVAANKFQEQLKGDAQRSTDTRDRAVKELTDWMAGFYKIARLAFEDDRQQLEKFGIVTG